MKKTSFPTTVATLACLGIATSMVFAEASPRRMFGKEHPFRVEELPEGKLKTHLQSLDPQGKEKAMTWLHTLDFGAGDAAEHLRVDNGGGIFIVCPDSQGDCEGHSHGNGKPDGLTDSPGTSESITPEPAQTTEPPLIAYAAVSVSSPPAYHSRPDATKRIYLDFNGGIVTGTAWNSGVSSFDVKVWSQDSDRTTFNDSEQAWMKKVWQRVSEDYAPFDVDVTTDVAYDPDNYTGNKDYVGWLMICETTDNNGAALPHNGAGGVAYVGKFGDPAYSPSYQPAWVSSTNGGGSESIISEAASHEMGHNMGCFHDGTSTSTYYGGHGSGDISWGPIMGSAYNRNVSQWSKGEYYNANQLQDDLTLITNRVAYRADDHANSAGTATPLTITNRTTISSTTPENDPSNSNPANKGVIERNTDVDVFSFSTGAGTVTINAKPWLQPSGTRGGNLDILLELYDAAGSLVASNNAANLTSAAISTTLVRGNYFLHVRNTGTGTPLVSPPSGYTSYGSIGQYFISGTIVDYNPSLALASITPASGNAGTTVTVDITGISLSAQTAVKLRKPGRANIIGSNVQMIGNTLRCQFNLTGAASGAWDLVATNPNLETSTLSAAFIVNGVLATVWSENFDGTVAGWTSQATNGSNNWTVTTAQSQSPTKSYFAPGPASITTAYLTSPGISVPSDSSSLQFKFWHNYNLESGKDGGRLEFSINGGAWFDVTDSGSGASFAGNGYNSTLSSGGGGPNAPSDFGGRSAWSGNSGGFVETTVNFNDIAKYAGKSLRARWGIATNASTASTGWYVDSVSLLKDSSPPNQPPVVTVAASTSSSETQIDPGPIVFQVIRGTDTNFSVTATDDAGEPDLTYAWSVAGGPAPVVFAINENNTAKTTTANFTAVGDYQIMVTVSDTGGLTATSLVNVRVLPTGTYEVSPDPAIVQIWSTQQFAASLNDQFGAPLASQPSPTNWSVSGGGTINSSGLFNATTIGGPFEITASSGGYSTTASVTVTLASATITLGNLNQTYDGGPKPVSVTTDPPGLAYSITYDGSADVPINAATYAVDASITAPNYTGIGSGSLVVAKASQSITFASLPTVALGDAPFPLGATASSGLAVSYTSSNPSVATVSGDTVTLIGVGSTTITASQAGNANYQAAASVQRSLSVILANPVAYPGGPYKLLVGGTLSLDGSASLPTGGQTIASYEWDLNNDNTFSDVTGATPAAISFSVLTNTWGMLPGSNTIKLRVTDTSGKTSNAATTTVNLVLALTWDANGTTANQTDGAGVWLDPSKWWDGSTNVTWPSGSDAVFGKSGTGGAVTLASPTTVNSLILNSFGGTYTLGTAGQILTLNNGIIKNAGSGAVTFLSPITLGAAQTWTNNSTGLLKTGNLTLLTNGGFQLTIDGTGDTEIGQQNVANPTLSGSGALVKNGTGRLFIGGDNSAVFSGDVTINNGSLNYGDVPTSLGTGNLKITNGMLESRWTTGKTWVQGTDAGQIQITAGVSGFSSGNAATFDIGAVTWGSSTFNPTKFAFNTATSVSGAAVKFSSAINLNGATRTILVNGGTGGNARAELSGVISNGSGTSGLTKEGTGFLLLTTNAATSVWAGNTTVSGGLLHLGAANLANIGGGSGRNISVASGAGVGFNVLSNAILNRIVETTAEISVMTGTTSNAFDFSSGTGATLTNAFLGTYSSNGAKAELSGIITMGGGSYRLGAPGTLNNGTLGIRQESLLSGANGLVIGANRVVIVGTHTFTGDTTLRDGAILGLSGRDADAGAAKNNSSALQNSVLDLGAPSSTGLIFLEAGTAGGITGLTTVGNGATQSATFGGLKGSRNLYSAFRFTGAGNNTSAKAATAITGFTLNPGAAVSCTYTGTIADFATGTTITKTGPGTQILSGTNTFTGDTNVNEGKLLINGSLSNTGAALNVANGATLGGAGTIGRNVTIAAGGRLEFDISTNAASHDRLDISSGRSFGISGASELTVTSSGGAVSGIYTLVTGGNNITGLAPSTLNLPENWVATVSISGNSLLLNLTSTAGDTTPPTLASSAIVDDKSGGPVTVNTLVTYTVTFSEDMNASTVTAADFGNAGTSSVTIGTVTEITPGVFAVQATPTSAGTLRLRINAAAVLTDVAGNELDTASPIPDDTILTVQSVYDHWSGGADFQADANGDGVSNGVAWALGAANPSSDAIGLLPTFDATDPAYFIYTYRRSDAAAANSTIAVQYGSNLGSWANAADDAVNIIITEINDFYGVGIDKVEVKFKRSLAPGGKLFARLNVVSPL